MSQVGNLLSKKQAVILAVASFAAVLLFLVNFLLPVGEQQSLASVPDWYNTDWSFRKKITIDHTKVDSDLTDFPVLINYDEEGDLKQYAKSDGTDILFTSSDGTTKLSHEIETYNNSDGQLVVHVKVPSLSSTTNTELYMYYGNAGAADQQNIADVWSNGYLSTWHMEEGSGTSIDSSLENWEKDSFSTSADWWSNGKFGNGVYFESGSVNRIMTNQNYTTFYKPYPLTNGLTFGAWIKIPDGQTDEDHYYFSNYRQSERHLRYYGIIYNPTDGLQVYGDSRYRVTKADFSQFDQWVYVVAVIGEDGANIEGYFNGDSFGNNSASYSDYNVLSLNIGEVSGNSQEATGHLDELRISSTARSAEWISTEYNNQNSPSTFYTTTGAEAESVGWYNASWKYRKKLTIDNTKVDADLVDFPISISLTDGNIVNKAQADGDDIVITATDGSSKLSHEIEEFNEDTGELVLHVKIPQLSQNTDTDIYIYYGNESATNQQNPTDVWSNGYAGVWHMNEDSGTTVYDSTSNANHGTINTGSNLTVTDESFTSSHDTAVNLNKRELQSGTETVTTSDGLTTYTKDTDYTMDYAEGQITVLSTGAMADATSYLIDYTYDNTGVVMGQDGQMGDAMEFDGVDDYIETADFSWSVADSYSIQTYYKATDIAKENSIIGKANYEYTLRQDYDRLEFVHWASDESNSIVLVDESGSIVGDSWYGLSVVYDSVETQSMLYKNSTEIDISTPSSDFENKDEPTLIGYGYSVSLNPKYAAGFIDEVRISSVARSSEWISAEYANQNSPSTFYSVASEETTNPDWYSTDWNFRKEITIDNTKVDDDLVSFPVLINQDADSELAAEAQSDADDILFTDTNGYKLSHEIEKFDSDTGELVVWVKIPELSSSVDTNIIMYYGNRTVANQENVADVWSNGYAGVWHLSEDYWDSSGNYQAYNSLTTRHGTPRGNAAIVTDEKFGNVGDFTDTTNTSDTSPAHVGFWNQNAELKFDSDATAYSVQGWFKGDQLWDSYMLSYGDTDSSDYYIRTLSADGGIRFSAGEAYADLNHNFQDNNWHQVSLVNQRNDGAYQFKGFVDGSSFTTDWANSGSERESNNGFKIGCRDWTWGGNTVAGFKGYMHEVRVSNAARTAEWISTEYNNQNSPSTFYVLGAQTSWDTTDPVNPTSLSGWETSAKITSITNEDWNNDSNPHFEWSGAEDNPGGSGLDGYYIYYGPDELADPEETSGIISDDGAPLFLPSVSYTLDKSMADDETYYFRIKTIDLANNITDAETYFTYRYDPRSPNSVDIIDVDPVGCTTEQSFTFTWQDPGDVGMSGIRNYEYKRGSTGSIFELVETTLSESPYQNLDNVLYVRAVDNAGNKSEWRTKVYCVTGFVTLEVEPETVSGPTSLKVEWRTSRETTGYVEVFENDKYITEQGHDFFSTKHDIQVLGLKSERNYLYRLNWSDIDGNRGVSDWYETSTTKNPQVSDLKAQALSPSEVLVSFQTNYEAISIIKYGPDNFADEITLATPATIFSEKLSNLAPGTNYTLKVLAESADGAFFSSGITFKTPPYPEITDLVFDNVYEEIAPKTRVSWKTNVEATSSLFYKTAEADSYIELSTTDKVLNHEVIIANLADNSNYQLFVKGIDSYGNQATSDTLTFTTPLDTRAPTISNILIETSNVGLSSEDKAQVAISFNTDEPASCYIEYTEGITTTDYTAKTPASQSYQQKHLTIISELKPQTPYNFRVSCRDQISNLSQSPSQAVVSGEVSQSILTIILRTLNNLFGWMGELM